MDDRIEGGCFCGSIRYNFERNNYLSVNCYCSMCRLISAAPFVSWLNLPLSRFEYTQGKPKKLNSSSEATRYFCEECGTPLAFISKEDSEDINITVCSLDKPQDFEPKSDIYIDDKLSWVKNDY